MNEEELFCKLFPEYAVNGKPLSPYFDLFESGYEQSEKHIAELEKENEMFKKANEIIAQQRDGRDADISILENRIEDLKSQIKKMKCCGNCYRIENCEADGVCDNWELRR